MKDCKPLVLSTRFFKTRVLAKKHFRDMLARYQPGERISDSDAADLDSLLHLYPFRRDIVWYLRTIAHFEVEDSDFGKKCFRVVMDNGSHCRFSYIKCILLGSE